MSFLGDTDASFFLSRWLTSQWSLRRPSGGLIMGNLSPTCSAMSLYNNRCQLLLVWLFLKPKVVQLVVKFSRRLCLFQCSSPQLLLLKSGLLALIPALGGWGEKLISITLQLHQQPCALGLISSIDSILQICGERDWHMANCHSYFGVGEGEGLSVGSVRWSGMRTLNCLGSRAP